MAIIPKKKVLLAAIFCFLVLFFVLFYLFWLPAGPKAGPEPGPSAPADEAVLQEKVAEIVKTKNFDKCQEIASEYYRTVCTNTIALNLTEETQDIGYCKKLDDYLVSVAGCERKILFEKSQKKEDISVCNETANSEIQKECQESFWPTLALKKNDVSLCGNIAEEQKRNLCHDNSLFQQEFLKAKSSFDCQKFYSQDVKLDCEVYKEMLLNKKLVNCNSLKSGLFLNYCILPMHRMNTK